MRLLLILVALVVLAAIVYGLYALKNFARNRREKKADDILERFRELAWEYRDVAPELSAVIISEVQDTKNKEKA